MPSALLAPFWWKNHGNSYLGSGQIYNDCIKLESVIRLICKSKICLTYLLETNQETEKQTLTWKIPRHQHSGKDCTLKIAIYIHIYIKYIKSKESIFWTLYQWIYICLLWSISQNRKICHAATSWSFSSSLSRKYLSALPVVASQMGLYMLHVPPS